MEQLTVKDLLLLLFYIFVGLSIYAVIQYKDIQQERTIEIESQDDIKPKIQEQSPSETLCEEIEALGEPIYINVPNDVLMVFDNATYSRKEYMRVCK